MRLRNLGKQGPQVSEIAFGAWAIGGGWGQQADADSLRTLNAALDAGVNLIDTAEGYGNGHSEALIAQVVKQRPSAARSLFVATKTPPAPGPWPPSPYCRHQDRYSAAYLRQNVEQRLRALQVERLDLLQLHTWTSAWNADPQPLLELRKLQAEGKLGLIGVSTPEQDQNCVVELMQHGLVDVVQVIFNLFHQEPAARLLPVAEQTGTGVLIRVALDEGSLTGKYGPAHTFAADDFRAKYFAGDRMARTVARVEAIQADLAAAKIGAPGQDQAQLLRSVAIRFALAQAGVSSVITGMRTPQQAQENAAVSDATPLPTELLTQLRRHNWLRGVWYGGK